MAFIKKYMQVFGIALALVGLGLQMSGVLIPLLGYSLMGLGVIIMLIMPVLSIVEKFRSSRLDLVISMPEIYEVGDGSHWLRMRVENPTASPVQNCYGKLLDRKQVAGALMKVDGELVRPALSAESGRQSMEHMEFPPEGHRFPWSPVDRQLTTISISGNGGFEYLYIVTKRKTIGCFWFPTSAGNEYENWSLGDFGLELEIGSESKTLKPRRVRVVFRTGEGYLELVSLDTLD